MIRKRHLLSIVPALIIGAAALLFFFLIQAKTPDSARVDPGMPQLGTPMLNQSVAHLYFADKDNLFLISEERILYHADGPIPFGKRIIEALIKGPAGELARTLPAATALRALYITAEGVCYVDLTADVKENYPGGVKSELLALYSIVNSLILNLSEIEAVKILIDGQESATLAGHIDLQYPVKANMLLIR